jgi:N6-adenosine-specific RNA methylase IME4
VCHVWRGCLGGGVAAKLDHGVGGAPPLLGVRGKAPIQFRSQGTWFVAPRQEHSHKPEESYAMVERCSPGPYLELFARRKQPGWDNWGNEIAPDVAL